MKLNNVRMEVTDLENEAHERESLFQRQGTCTCTCVMDFSRLSLYCPYLMVFQWASKRFLKELTEVASTTCWGRLFQELITLWLTYLSMTIYCLWSKALQALQTRPFQFTKLQKMCHFKVDFCKFSWGPKSPNGEVYGAPPDPTSLRSGTSRSALVLRSLHLPYLEIKLTFECTEGLAPPLRLWSFPERIGAVIHPPTGNKRESITA